VGGTRYLRALALISLLSAGLCACGSLPARTSGRPPNPLGPADKAGVAIACEGEYGLHLQGIATDGADAVYWTFTMVLVKTDLTGKVLAKAKASGHLGGLTYHDGRVYVAFCVAWDHANDRSKVFVYDAEDLSLLDVKSVPEVEYGAGGIEFHKGRFYIVGGEDPKRDGNRIYEYDGDFRHIASHAVPSGPTELGVQTIGYFDHHFWLGCYGDVLLKVDESCRLVAKHRFDASYGMAPWGGGDVLVARTPYRLEGNSKRWRGVVRLARPDSEKGLAFYDTRLAPVK